VHTLEIEDGNIFNISNNDDKHKNKKTHVIEKSRHSLTYSLNRKSKKNS